MGEPKRTTGIRPTPSGKWQARYHDPSGRLRGKTFRRKTDAVAFLHATRTSVRHGTWVDPARAATRYEACAQTWLDNKLNVRRSTFRRDEECLRLHILPVSEAGPCSRSPVPTSRPG